jgi:hypothetical protein
MDKNNIPQFHSAPTYAAPPPRAPAPRVHGEAVRAFKADGSASKADVDAADEALNVLKIEAGVAACRLQQAVGAGASGAAREELRQAVVNTLVRKLFYIPSFKIYRGVAGHYGPPGCRIKANVLSFWSQVMPTMCLELCRAFCSFILLVVGHNDYGLKY